MNILSYIKFLLMLQLFFDICLQLKLLEMLPSLASHSIMVPIIMQTILPMLHRDAKPYAIFWFLFDGVTLSYTELQITYEWIVLMVNSDCYPLAALLSFLKMHLEISWWYMNLICVLNIFLPILYGMLANLIDLFFSLNCSVLSEMAE